MLTVGAAEQSEYRKAKKKLHQARQRQKLASLTSQHANSPLVKALATRLRQKNTVSKRHPTYSLAFSQAQGRRTQRETQQVRQVLDTLVQAGEADRWLAAPNALLGGDSPLDCIRQGQTRQVKELVERLAQGLSV